MNNESTQFFFFLIFNFLSQFNLLSFFFPMKDKIKRERGTQYKIQEKHMVIFKVDKKLFFGPPIFLSSLILSLLLLEF
jgi:hypothetical protein